MSEKNVFEHQYLWVFEVDECGGVDSIIAAAKTAKCGICVKWHDGDPSDDGKWDFQGKFNAIASKALPLGIPLLAWGYCYGDAYGNLLKEADAACSVLRRYPTVGYVIDAEAEWENKKSGEWARKFCQHIYSKVPDVKKRLAYAPFWSTRWHSLYPSKEFSRFCSAVMPQTYFDLGKRPTRESREEMIRITSEDYARYGLPIYPVAEFAAGVAGIADFLEIAETREFKAWSWWLLDRFQDSRELKYLAT